jgi:hypothetical protein
MKCELRFLSLKIRKLLIGEVVSEENLVLEVLNQNTNNGVKISPAL